MLYFLIYLTFNCADTDLIRKQSSTLCKTEVSNTGVDNQINIFLTETIPNNMRIFV